MYGVRKLCKIYMKKLIFILLSFVQVSHSYDLKIINKLYHKVDLEILYYTSNKMLHKTTYPLELLLELGFGIMYIQQIKLVRSSLVNDYILIQLPPRYQSDLYLVIDTKYGTFSDITYQWLTKEQYKKYLKVL